MMRPKFQADNDLNGIIVSGLRRKAPEIDFQSAFETGLEGREDDEVLAKAADGGRILVSHDKNTMLRYFGEFVKHRSSPGLIILIKRVSFAVAIDEIVLIWAASSSG